jgi:hypothetical protein
VYVEAAFGLARRVLTDLPDAAIEEQLRHAFRLCLARSPHAAELAVLQRLFDEQRGSGQSDSARIKQLLADQTVPPASSPAEFAAWHAITTTLLNLDETITKN